MSGQPTLRFRFFSEAPEAPASASPSDVRATESTPTNAALETARKTWSDARRRLSELEARATGRVFTRTEAHEQCAEVEQSDAA